MEYVIVFLLVVVLVRNALKDKSDGRDYLGGTTPDLKKK